MREKLKRFFNIVGGILFILISFALIIVTGVMWSEVSTNTATKYLFIGFILAFLLIGSAMLYDGCKKKSNNSSNVINNAPNDQIKTINGPAGVIAEFNNTKRQCRFWEGLSFRGKEYLYSQIVSYELIENGESIISGGLGSAVVGGLLFGFGGAIIGGVTGERTSREKCVSLIIKITINDMSKPTIFLSFIDKYSAVEKSSSKYNKITKQVHECLSALQLVCETQSTEVISEVPTVPTKHTTADEIRKFKNLLDEGVITNEEFEAAKRNLLSMS